MIKILIFILSLQLLTDLAHAEDFVSVKIREAKLRTRAEHWSASVANLKYGDRLLKLKEENGWIQASFTDKKIGFIQTSAISDKQIVLTTAQASLLQTGSGDLILAGKGFSKATEKDFSQQNPALDFSELNKLEQFKISDQEMLSFVKVGKLSGVAK